MPPRWPRKPDRKNDPAYRKLDDRMNFAIHAMVATLINSGLWFFHKILVTEWEWLPWLTASWAGVVLLHLIYLVAIADYSDPSKST